MIIWLWIIKIIDGNEDKSQAKPKRIDSKHKNSRKVVLEFECNRQRENITEAKPHPAYRDCEIRYYEKGKGPAMMLGQMTYVQILPATLTKLQVLTFTCKSLQT